MSEQHSPTGQHDPKTTAIISYITPVGWLIAYFVMYANNKSNLAGFHLRQTLLLYIIGFVLNVFTRMFFWGFMWWVPASCPLPCSYCGLLA